MLTSCETVHTVCPKSTTEVQTFQRTGEIFDYDEKKKEVVSQRINSFGLTHTRTESYVETSRVVMYESKCGTWRQ